MEERSRIRFNPATKEIEVEGSETFVRTYFQKLQRMLEQAPAKKRAIPSPKEARPIKRAGAKAAPGRKRGAKETQMDAVVSLVVGSGGGITTAGLKERTGLSERQIWSIVYRAQKEGKIKKTKRGLYVPA